MRSTLITCAPETTLGQAAVLLARHRVHALVVAGADGQPLGILSDTDLLAGEWLSTDVESLAAMRSMTAGQLMTQPPAAIEADTSVAQAAARMRSEHIHRLLVVEAGRAVGIISVSDLVAHLGRTSVERRTVANVMSRGIVTCLEDTPLAAAARAMTERRSRSIVVVNKQGRPLGVITGADLLSGVEGDEGAQTVADLMHPPLTIAPTATLREAADQMLRHHVHRLVVVDPANLEGMPLGLISTSDIVAEMAEPESVWQSK
jgi:CBS domain-containing protein